MPSQANPYDNKIHFNIHIDPSYLELSMRVAQLIENRAELAIAKRQVFSLVLSGGQTPSKIYEILAGLAITWEHVHLFWTDERMVPTDSPDSNFNMVREKLLSKVQIPVSNVHRIKAELPNSESAARLYESEIHSFFDQYSASPSFDLVLLGVGVDGHTASLFPEVMEKIIKSPNWVETMWIDKLRSRRISLCPSLINQAREIVVIASGHGKSSILKKVLEPEGSTMKYPIQFVHPRSEEIMWCLDREAASELDVSKESKI